MAVLQMQRVVICALKRDRKRILEMLQRRGVIEINEMAEDSVFHKTDTSTAKSLFEKNIAYAKEALEILDSYDPVKKSKLDLLIGRSEVSSKIYDEFKNKYDRVADTARHICKIHKQIAELNAEILKLNVQWEMLTPWMSLDIPFHFSGTKNTACFIGTLPGTWSLEMIYERFSDYAPLNIEIVSSSREQTCVFILCLKEQKDAVSDALRAIGFSYPGSLTDKIPSEQRRDIGNTIASAKRDIENAIEEIKSYSEQRNDLRFLMDYDTMRAEKYAVIGQLIQSRRAFVMTGYIAGKECDALESELADHYGAAVEFNQPDEDEDVPVLLSNNSFSRPLEGIVESYSLPGKGELDPTTVMSLFYYLLFGLMLSDAVYGAIIALGCGIGLLRFKKAMEESTKNTLTMFFFCGLSTIFWGVMFGSYFGDFIDVVSSLFFGKKISIPPLWFVPVNQPMRMLVFSMALGILHLLTGLGMKFYQCLKHKDYKALIYDVVFWYVLLIGILLKLLSMQMIADIFGLSFILPQAVGNAAGLIAAIGALGIILTNGRESRNPFKRFLKGLYALYGITGYLSDVLSYSRLLALGLATGVIANVINQMAGMLAGLPGGVIPFIIVCIFGHLFNLAINTLGAYVHTNRLQYVEFFGKFYEGGGRKFSPFNAKTKYYKFREE